MNTSFKFCLLLALPLCFFWCLRSQAQDQVNRINGRLDTWIIPILPFDFDSPKIRIISHYVYGDQPIMILVPTEEEIPLFTRLEILADGNRVPYQPKIKLLDHDFEKQVVLDPGKSFELVIPLNKLPLTLPKEWESLEVEAFHFEYYNVQGQDILLRPAEAAAIGTFRILRPRWRKPDVFTFTYQSTTPEQRKQAVQTASMGYANQIVPDDQDKVLANFRQNENDAMLQELKEKTRFAPPVPGQKLDATGWLYLQSAGRGYNLRYDVEDGLIEISPEEWGIVSDKFKNWIKSMLPKTQPAPPPR